MNTEWLHIKETPYPVVYETGSLPDNGFITRKKERTRWRKIPKHNHLARLTKDETTDTTEQRWAEVALEFKHCLRVTVWQTVSSLSFHFTAHVSKTKHLFRGSVTTLVDKVYEFEYNIDNIANKRSGWLDELAMRAPVPIATARQSVWHTSTIHRAPSPPNQKALVLSVRNEQTVAAQMRQKAQETGSARSPSVVVRRKVKAEDRDQDSGVSDGVGRVFEVDDDTSFVGPMVENT